jgi:hypothetical protein
MSTWIIYMGSLQSYGDLKKQNRKIEESEKCLRRERQKIWSTMYINTYTVISINKNKMIQIYLFTNM